MPTVIDHTVFPRVVGTIVQLADFPTQLAFRATSTKFCAIVDAFLFKHALLTIPNHPSSCLRFRNLPTSPAYNPNNYILSRAVEVVDADLPVNIGHRTHVLDVLPRLHTIRRLGFKSTSVHFGRASTVRTVVDFVKIAPSTPKNPLITVSSSQERHIIHIRYDAHNPQKCYPCILFDLMGPAVLAEFFIVLWPDYEGDNINILAPPILYSLVHELALYLRHYGTLKIVGLEYVGYESLYIRDDLADDLAELAESKDCVDDILDAISIVTFEEWEKDLGPRLKIEGMWSPLIDFSVRLAQQHPDCEAGLTVR